MFRYLRGAALGEYAWFSVNRGPTTHAVAQKQQNAFGLYDTHGNAWEWVQDIWRGDYKGASGDGTAWVIGGDQARRVLRGGAWGSIPRVLRSANRDRYAPDFRYVDTGMRIARTN